MSGQATLNDMIGDEPNPASIDAVIAWLVNRTGKTIATNKRLVGLWIKAHGVAKLLDAFEKARQADPVNPVGYLGAVLAGQPSGRAELGAIPPARAASPPIVVEPPAHRVTANIIRVRNKLIEDWKARDADIHQDMHVEEYGNAEYMARSRAWLLAQQQLLDGIERALPFSAADYQTAKDRAESQGRVIKGQLL
jgi:hypothetical protein